VGNGKANGTSSRGEARSERIEQISRCLDAIPTPKWLEPESSGNKSIYRLAGFRSFQAFQLRSDWLDLVMNLRSVLGHHAERDEFDLQRADEAVSILDRTRKSLEYEKPNAELIDDELGQVRRLLMWLVPDEWLDAQVISVNRRLEASNDPAAKVALIKGVVADRRYALDNATGVLNRIAATWMIDSSLQKRRFQWFRNIALIGLLVLVILGPILISGDGLASWGLGPVGSPLVAWFTAIGIAAIGAMGAFLSAFLQLRDRPVTYADYQVRGDEVAVRAAVGATLAVVTYFLLSFNVIPGIRVASPGTYLLIAFGAGFSERYVLGLLKLDSSSSARPPTPVTPKVGPASPTEATAASGAQTT